VCDVIEQIPGLFSTCSYILKILIMCIYAGPCGGVIVNAVAVLPELLVKGCLCVSIYIYIYIYMYVLCTTK
jgi:hypothetical protein